MTRVTSTTSRRMLLIAALALGIGLATQTLGIDLAYSQTMSVTVWSANADPGVDPDWSGWKDVPTAPVPLTAQQTATPVGGGSTFLMGVQAVHTGDDMVLRLSWRDMTEDTSAAGTELFTDAVAVQFPAIASSSVPAICMGQADGAVNIWHWRADSQVGMSGLPDLGDGYVDGYPDTSETYYPAAASGNPLAAEGAVQNLLAGSFGTLTPADDQSVVGEGRYGANEWAVVLRRPLTAPSVDHPEFAVGQTIDVAFAVWNGSASERNGIKSVSQFVRFDVSDTAMPAPVAVAAPPSATAAGYLVVVLVGGAILVLLLMALVWFGVVARDLLRARR